MIHLLDRWFTIHERGSSVRLEILGGATTFATMAYIIVVNPAILLAAGLPMDASTIATILAAVFGCTLMGLYANRPIAVAPYMGENAFIAFALVGVSWQQRLGSVFIAGAIFLILTLLRARTWLAAAISPSLKHSFAIGIGLFLMFIGLIETKIVVRPEAPDAPPVKIGDFRDPHVQLALGGFAIMVVLTLWRVRAILIGIAATATLGFCLGEGKAPTAIVALPNMQALDQVCAQLDVAGVLHVDFFSILLTLFLISFLDTIGTIYALGATAGMLDDKGQFADVERPMVVDSLSCMFSALIGTSTSGAFIESATGIREGARTGLAAIVTGLLFAAALFFLPLLTPLQELKFAYFPALMLVGVSMFSSARHLDTEDMTELIPAVATIAMMVFTFNIANGLTAGLILHPVLKLLTGRLIHPGAARLGGLCVTYYVVGIFH